MNLRLLSVLTLLSLAACARAGEPPEMAPAVATFSIVAADPETGEIGVAVQSKVVAVGAIVPWAKAGVGAVATQSYANTTYGQTGLKLLAQGEAPDAVIGKLVSADPRKALRQVGVINAAGVAANFTGKECMDWAGAISGKNFSVQGNLLAGEGVVRAMAEAFRASDGKVLAQRLIDALRAGQEAGGDKRGKQSAALLVVRDGWGYAGLSDRFRDLRVDDHQTPIAELQRVYDIHKKVFRRPAQAPESGGERGGDETDDPQK